MTSPFPGMDPYLEMHWGDVHTSLTVYARDQLQRQMPPGLHVRTEEYVTVESDTAPGYGIYPDVRVVETHADAGTVAGSEAATTTAVAEPLMVPMHDEPQTLRFLQIIDSRSGNRIVTTIEFLSRANKMSQAGRTAYRQKQRDLFDGGVNLVEIDLLREGDYVLAAPAHHIPASHLAPYRICVVRATDPLHAEVYRATYREPLPTIRIPLRESDKDAELNLQELIDVVYVNGGYNDTDYHADPQPSLPEEDAKWADQLLKEKGLRLR